MISRIEQAGENHDTVGGVVSGVAMGVPAGWANLFSISFMPI